MYYVRRGYVREIGELWSHLCYRESGFEVLIVGVRGMENVRGGVSTPRVSGEYINEGVGKIGGKMKNGIEVGVWG